jgi:hypothetical protein
MTCVITLVGRKRFARVEKCLPRRPWRYRRFSIWRSAGRLETNVAVLVVPHVAVNTLQVRQRVLGARTKLAHFQPRSLLDGRVALTRRFCFLALCDCVRCGLDWCWCGVTLFVVSVFGRVVRWSMVIATVEKRDSESTHTRTKKCKRKGAVTGLDSVCASRKLPQENTLIQTVKVRL